MHTNMEMPKLHIVNSKQTCRFVGIEYHLNTL